MTPSAILKFVCLSEELHHFGRITRHTENGGGDPVGRTFVRNADDTVGTSIPDVAEWCFEIWRGLMNSLRTQGVCRRYLSRTIGGNPAGYQRYGSYQQRDTTIDSG